LSLSFLRLYFVLSGTACDLRRDSATALATGLTILGLILIVKYPKQIPLTKMKSTQPDA